MKPGRKHFFEGLRGRAQGLVGRVVREQMTHAEYLRGRAELANSTEWARSTSTARGELHAYLDGAIETLHATGAIVWKHRARESGAWLASPLPQGTSYDTIDPDQSRHVWASSDKVFFEPDSRNPADGSAR
jgi:hypothetical protein